MSETNHASKAEKDCDYHEGFEEGVKFGRAGSGPRPITDEMVDAATQALGVHRWKTMGVNTVECECGEIIGLPDAERTGDLIEDSILQAFPADLAFRKHLARVALEAAEGARRRATRSYWRRIEHPSTKQWTRHTLVTGSPQT